MISFDLYLMGYRGYECLKHLINQQDHITINQVVVAGDSGIRKDYKTEISQLCIANNINLSNKSKQIDNLDTNIYSLAISWRWLIDRDRLIIIHDSLLPKYRGFSPLVSQLLNKESILGVTALTSNDEGYDCGDIYARSQINISYPIKINDAIIKTTRCYTEVIDIVIELINKKKLVGRKQDSSVATYSLWRDENDYMINWSNNADYIERFVNALGFPYSGAQTTLDGNRVYVLAGYAYPDLYIENRIPGKLIMKDSKGLLIVVCGKGLYKITRCVNEHGEDIIAKNNNFRLRFR